LCINPELETGKVKFEFSALLTQKFQFIESPGRASIIKTERDCLPIMLEMFRDYYLPFSGLKTENQVGFWCCILIRVCRKISLVFFGLKII
jgi:hypothetical protein